MPSSTLRPNGHTLAQNAVAAPFVAVSQDSPLAPRPSSLSQDFDALSRMLLQRLAVAIEDEELTPAELSRLGSCFAQNQQAFARLQAQKISQQRFTHDRIAQKRKEATKEKYQPAMSLEERIRRIYGIDMPKGGPPTTTRASP